MHELKDAIYCKAHTFFLQTETKTAAQIKTPRPRSWGPLDQDHPVLHPRASTLPKRLPPIPFLLSTCPCLVLFFSFYSVSIDHIPLPFRLPIPFPSPPSLLFPSILYLFSLSFLYSDRTYRPKLTNRYAPRQPETKGRPRPRPRQTLVLTSKPCDCRQNQQHV
jgi:hypothetical protein